MRHVSHGLPFIVIAGVYAALASSAGGCGSSNSSSTTSSSSSSGACNPLMGACTSSSGGTSSGGTGGSSTSSSGTTTSSSSGGTGGSTSSSSSSSGAGGGASSSSTSSSSSGGVDATACAAFAKAECTRNDTCSLSGFLNDKTYGSEAVCEARLATVCVAELMSNGTGATVAQLQTCTTAIPGETCPEFFDDVSSACYPLAGTLATGAGCVFDSQCASTFCDVPAAHVCGKCQAAPQVGAACVAGDDCGASSTLGKLVCAIPNGQSAGKCAATVAINGACSDMAPCRTGLSCLAAKCVAKGATVGAACDTSGTTKADCAFVDGLACIPTAPSTTVGTCQAITLAGAGAACGNMGNPVTSVVDCAGGGMCVNNKCVAHALIGGACDTVKGPGCLAPVVCVPTNGTAGTCVDPATATCP